MRRRVQGICHRWRCSCSDCAGGYMADTTKPLAVVTGASSGIGFELAKLCAESGFNLIIAADMPEITEAADALRSTGVEVEALQIDLATQDGVNALHALVGG